ncbi:MAG TPA: RNA polymerase sigma factor [Actinomycetota bacterium]|jgi:RNA polymerase sigma-70 factor (ECF subfamily)
MSVTDEEVLLASRSNGDRFGELFDRHFGTIYRYLHRRVGSDLADELAAETFVRAFQHRDSYDPQRAPVRAWLFGIATNLVRRHHRSEHRRLAAYAKAPLDLFQDEGTAAIDTRVSADALSATLGRSLATMRSQDRDVLLLIAWADLTYAEVAAALGTPIGTVRSRLARARQHIRKDLPDVSDWSADNPTNPAPAAGGAKGAVLHG